MPVKENKVYTRYVAGVTPKTNEKWTLLTAFCIGGLICMIGQGIGDALKALFPSLPKDGVSDYTTIILIFLGSLLTALGVYDDIGKFAGAGSMVPITGFANSVVSPAIEFKSEGMIYGVESKMFAIAGPIIVTGVVSSVAVGILYFFIGG